MMKVWYKIRMGGRWKQGRPRNRWADEVKTDLNRMGMSLWRHTVGDQNRWRVVVGKGKAHTKLY